MVIAQLDGTGRRRRSRRRRRGRRAGHAWRPRRSSSCGRSSPARRASGRRRKTSRPRSRQALRKRIPELHVAVPTGMQVLILTGAPQVDPRREGPDRRARRRPAIGRARHRDPRARREPVAQSRPPAGHDVDRHDLHRSRCRRRIANGQPGRYLGASSPVAHADQFQAQINLLLQNGSARVLADPRITTLSGHTATIRAGDTISILTTVGGGPARSRRRSSKASRPA